MDGKATNVSKRGTVSSIVEKTYNYIREHKLIDTNDAILIALSGGKDSVVLLDIIIKLKERLKIKKVGVVHLNHSLRGEESDGDEKFCIELSKKYDIEFYNKKVNIKLIALESKKSLEEAGREERYKFFEEIVVNKGYDKIATAHTKNDQVETLLMRLIKGTGLDGFMGIPAKREKIIRPLLILSTDEIYNYINDNRLEYREDYTNALNTYERNKIRNIIIPACEDINSAFADSLFRFQKIVSDARFFINKEVEKAVEKHFFLYNDGYILELKNIEPFLLAQVLNFILKKYYKMTVSFTLMDSVLKMAERKESGKFIVVSDNLQIHYNFERFYFVQSEDFFIEDEIKLVMGKNIINKYGYTIFLEQVDSLPFKFKENEYFIPMDTVDFDSFCVRTRKHGDIFVSDRNGKHRKLKKYFNDIKLPRVLRDKTLLLADKNRIYAIIGIDKSIYVNNDGYDKYLKVTYEKLKVEV